MVLFSFFLLLQPAGFPAADSSLISKARTLCQTAILIDGHVDTPSLLDEKPGTDIGGGTSPGEFDFNRARSGGLDAPFMSIYIDGDYQATPGASQKRAEGLISLMDSVIEANPGRFAHAYSPDDIRKNAGKGLISLPYGMENGAGLEQDLSLVSGFYRKGIRYITLSHGKRNRICDSSYDEDKGWNGLSPFGREVIREMNRVGILVDISHVSDSAFFQTIRLSSAPPIASHSSCRKFTPGFERNVSDEMLRALAAKGGIIMINFGSYFLTEAGNRYGDNRAAALKTFMSAEGIKDQNDPRVKKERSRWMKENPYPFATVQDVADHIDHAVKIAGIDHVGIGSDFDGVGDSLPVGLRSVNEYPVLVAELLKRRYSEKDIRKILGENFLRVWEETLKTAQKASGGGK